MSEHDDNEDFLEALFYLAPIDSRYVGPLGIWLWLALIIFLFVCYFGIRG